MTEKAKTTRRVEVTKKATPAKKAPAKKVAPVKAPPPEIKEMIPIAILCHFRTGSVLLRKVLAASGMVDCYKELGFGVGDINGIGNAIFHGFIQDPGIGVNKALTLFKEAATSKEWKYYGIKVDHILQAVCWKAMGESFFTHWPDAKYVVSIRHPAGILKSFEKIRRDTPKQDPGFTDQQIVDSWLSTHDATKLLFDKKEATLVVYPDDYESGQIKDVVKSMGLKWTEKADGHIDAMVLKESEVTDAEMEKFEKKYPAAVKMFEELLKYA